MINHKQTSSLGENIPQLSARLEAWEKENKVEELEPEKKEAKETEMIWKKARAASPRNGELTKVTSDDEPTE